MIFYIFILFYDYLFLLFLYSLGSLSLSLFYSSNGFIHFINFLLCIFLVFFFISVQISFIVSLFYCIGKIEDFCCTTKFKFPWALHICEAKCTYGEATFFIIHYIFHFATLFYIYLFLHYRIMA